MLRKSAVDYVDSYGCFSVSALLGCLVCVLDRNFCRRGYCPRTCTTADNYRSYCSPSSDGENIGIQKTEESKLANTVKLPKMQGRGGDGRDATQRRLGNLSLKRQESSSMLFAGAEGPIGNPARERLPREAGRCECLFTVGERRRLEGDCW